MRLKPVTLVVTFALGLLAGPLPAEAQQAGKVYRIGFLHSVSTIVAPNSDAFRQGMRELGYFEGKHYVLENRTRETKTDRLSDRQGSDQHDSLCHDEGWRSGKTGISYQSGAPGWKYHGSVFHRRGVRREALGATRGDSSRD